MTSHEREAERTPMRILLVEDNFFVATALRKSLEGLGCQVVGPVSTVEEGLAMASEQKLHGAVLDINILGGTSVPIAERLCERETPFIFVTGYASPSMLPDSFKSYTKLHKPVDERLLEITVAREFTSPSSSDCN